MQFQRQMGRAWPTQTFSTHGKARNHTNNGPTGEAGSKSLYVFASKDKLTGVANYLGQGNSIDALAAYLKLGGSTLKEAADVDAFTPNLLGQLEEAFKNKGLKFNRQWVEWRDADNEPRGENGARRPRWRRPRLRVARKLRSPTRRSSA